MQAIASLLLTKLLANPLLAVIILFLLLGALYVLYRLVHKPPALRYGSPIAMGHSKKQPGRRLYSRRLHLVGKPDYIMRDPDRYSL